MTMGFGIIGCGMIAVRTQYTLKDLPADRKRIREDIERVIPLSAGHYNHRISATAASGPAVFSATPSGSASWLDPVYSRKAM